MSRTRVSRRAIVGLAIALGPAAHAQGPLTEPFPAGLELSSLGGEIGLRLDGVAADDRSGDSVASAGDVNRDGVDIFDFLAFQNEFAAGCP